MAPLAPPLATPMIAVSQEKSLSLLDKVFSP